MPQQEEFRILIQKQLQADAQEMWIPVVSINYVYACVEKEQLLSMDDTNKKEKQEKSKENRWVVCSS
jgi:hypothetical protein